jgi:hypothetical protein
VSSLLLWPLWSEWLLLWSDMPAAAAERLLLLRLFGCAGLGLCWCFAARTAALAAVLVCFSSAVFSVFRDYWHMRMQQSTQQASAPGKAPQKIAQLVAAATPLIFASTI